ncbi:MAG TPA: chitin disaccharide deacetylase [Enterobacteriaceae bacterium]|nr:chitin disaccharide deacetylase [Enterobacteriaceae bacterium]
MQRLLIVNADDFGLSKGQNYGIIDACNNGLVTSTTALVNGAAAEHAAALSRRCPGLSVGMHFVLTLGAPLTAMPVLAPEGQLGKGIWQQAEQGQLPLEEIAGELEAQFSRFVSLFGDEPAHIDSHHHVHMMPQIFPLVADFAREKGIPLRVDREAVAQHALAVDSLRTSDYFASGFYGDAISEALFLQVLDEAVQRGVRSLEVMCHPAFIDKVVMDSSYCYPRLAELEVLTSLALKYAVAERGFRLGTYRDI